jgi:O-antigen/teichoic acid export membrane protein
MSQTVEQITSILKYSAIKMLPGVFGLITLPLVILYLGLEDYGRYSILQAYTLLVVAVGSALVTQPMYRYLSSAPDDQSKFSCMVIMVSAIASSLTLATVWLYSKSFVYASGMSLFSLLAILYAYTAVLFQLDGAIAKLAYIEFLRVGLFFTLVVGGESYIGSLTIAQVIYASVVSYATPMLFYMPTIKFEMPKLPWLRERFLYGLNGAVWLLIAGAPWLVGKAMIDSAAGSLALGQFSAISDIFYRGFGMINSAVVMSVFPLLSREWDSGNLGAVRRIYFLGLVVYLALSAASYFALCMLFWFFPEYFGDFDLLTGSTLLLIVACIIWQILSLTHKRIELALRVKENTKNILISFVIFQVMAYGSVYHSSYDAISAVASAIIVSGLYYALKSLMYRERYTG